MDNFLTIASSAAIGSLLGLVLKELFDLWRSKRAHRNELQRRYFDAKLDATIRSIQQVKTSSMTLRSLLGVVHQTEQADAWIDPGLFTNAFQEMLQTMRRTNEQAAGVVALLGFYYDDELMKLVQPSASPPASMLQDVSQFMQSAGRYNQIHQLLKSSHPLAPEDRATLERDKAEAQASIRHLIEKLAGAADELDELADRIVARMREAYDDIRF